MTAQSGWRWLMVSVLALGLSAAVSLAQAPPDLAGFGGIAPSPSEVVKPSAFFTATAAGGPARVFVRAKIKSGWHIYSITQASGGPRPTKITLDPASGYRQTGPFQAATAPEKAKEPVVWGDLVIESHHDKATWWAPIELASGANPQTLQIRGRIEAQACDKNTCLPPTEFPFMASLSNEAPTDVVAVAPPLVAARVNVAPAPPDPAGSASPRPAESAPPPRGVSPATAPERVSQRPAGPGKPEWQPYTTFDEFGALLGPEFKPELVGRSISLQKQNSSLVGEMILGFLGGILLNLMPCVLPVIGLKILSFVEQAGRQRRRGLLLNVSYSAGMLAVFLVLALLAVSLNLGWGHLFKYSAFNVAMAAVVFAMGLSFLGVWEIPIPGFVGHGKAMDLAEQEGLPAAFVKGCITTLLATPCAGPFMGAALFWAVGQPPAATIAVFMSVGLGMASPYLLIGLFPELIGFLPKPGAWMETFKQLMGFVLLGTVCYIFTFLDWAYVVPTLGLLIAIGAACWWVARTPLTAEFGARARAWVEAAVVIAAAWFLMFAGTAGILPSSWAFGSLLDVMQSRFEFAVESRAGSQGAHVAEASGAARPADGKTEAAGPMTVLVDCTADWCPNCKWLEATVLNSAEVRRLIAANGVVMLKADWTHKEATEVNKLLDVLGSRQVPQLAIFSSRDPNHPVVFREMYTQQQLLEAIEKAGPSQTVPKASRPAISAR